MDDACVATTLLDADQSILSGLASESTLSVSGKYRIGKMSNQLGTIIAISNEKDFVCSSQKFKNTARCILNSLAYTQNVIDLQRSITNKNTARLIHNLTSLNAHNIQEVYSLIPQEEISGKIKGHVEYVKQTVIEHPIDAANVLLRIAKNNAAMKAEFSVFKKLFNPHPEMHPSQHVVHKVLLNVLYLFFSDFTDKNVDIKIDRSDAKAYFDYESIHVALYHLIDNAAKYTKPSSTFDIKFDTNSVGVAIVFRMKSVRILETEINRIYEEGFSGSIPTKIGKAGNGIGMGIIRTIIQINGGSVNLKSDHSTRENDFGIDFEINEIVIELPAQPRRNNRLSDFV
ncbi:sensor histidine kinase [Rhodoferax lacus]|uniref:sensor histidine kinase n=1 Tax=Rhodoferax lacus TaxID=2184758 RepID=UPI0013142509|nr:ATP-binding protein [Rhodoferax lacus]